MFERRSFFAVFSIISAFFASFFASNNAKAKSSSNNFTFKDVEKRGTKGKLERLPTLDIESGQDFLTGFRNFVTRRMYPPIKVRFDQITKELKLKEGETLPLNELIKIVQNEPQMMMGVRGWVSTQQFTWKQILDYYHDHADEYLDEMESADNSGPGSVELNPDLKLPEYTKHEIHIQPAGYVGDPFSGYLNYYGVNNFYGGSNYNDEVQNAIVERVHTPEDNKVEKVLDIGCATGRLTFSLKRRFPEAKVYGLDVGGPMVRFAHTRGVDLGEDVHFVQRLAEDTKFPDNHFDLVTAYILFHEVTSEAQDKIVAEVKRILRPGGVFFPIDFKTGKQAPPDSPYRQFFVWWDHVYNGEPWRVEYASRDFAEVIKSHGFEVDEDIPAARRGMGSIKATKPA